MKSSTHTPPYLSIIVAARDNGADEAMLKRMRILIRGLLHQCKNFELPCELIIVEWNPPADQPRLREVLPDSGNTPFLQIRYLEVPPELHAEYKYSEHIELYPLIAKNVGIRRAKAPFVLCTNDGNLFAKRTFKILARRTLKEGWFYRNTRCDIPAEIDENQSVKDQLKFCKRNILEMYGKNNYYPNLTNTEGILFRIPFFHLLIFFYSKALSLLRDPKVDRWLQVDAWRSGDFTLMSQKDWIRINGYPELPFDARGVDWFAVYSAAAAGLQQKVLHYEARVYHMVRPDRTTVSSPSEHIQKALEQPRLDWGAVENAGRFMYEQETPHDFNEENWGLKGVELTETSA